jgi:hypothetical protein
MVGLVPHRLFLNSRSEGPSNRCLIWSGKECFQGILRPLLSPNGRHCTNIEAVAHMVGLAVQKVIQSVPMSSSCGQEMRFWKRLTTEGVQVQSSTWSQYTKFLCLDRQDRAAETRASTAVWMSH